MVHSLDCSSGLRQLPACHNVLGASASLRFDPSRCRYLQLHNYYAGGNERTTNHQQLNLTMV